MLAESRSASPSLNVVQAILEDALRAPSGDNCQPWRFTFDGTTLQIFHDNARGNHFLNRAGHASLLSLGCVLESIRLSASHHGFTAHWALTKHFRDSEAPWATVAFKASPDGEDRLYSALSLRATDRRMYRGGKLSAKMFEGVEHASNQQAVTYSWINDVPEALLRYICEADASNWLFREFHRDLMKWIRFSPGSKDGMPWTTLGISYAESRIMLLSRSWTVQNALNHLGFLRLARSVTRKQIKSSAGLVCVAARDKSQFSLVEAGVLTFRIWLTLNQQGYAVQPLTAGATSVFDLATGTLSTQDQAVRGELYKNGHALLANAFHFQENEIPCWMIRTGKQDPLPTQMICPRLSVSDVLELK